jgi:hypothetical protein
MSKAIMPAIGRNSLTYGAAYGPHALKVIGQAFDAAWAEIECQYRDDKTSALRARNRLARTMLEASTADVADPEALKAKVLRQLAQVRPIIQRRSA